MATQVIFDDIVRFLRQEGLTFGINAKNCLAVTLEGNHETYTIIIKYIWEKELVVLYVEYPFKAAQETLGHVLDLAALINWGLLFSTCEVNTETGAVRFRSTMLTDDAPFYQSQFATILSTACSAADHYAPAFRAVIERRCTPGEALGIISGKAGGGNERASETQ